MKKIKVMHVLNTGGYSGAEHVVIDFIHSVNGRCESIYVSKEGKIRDVLDKEGIVYYPLKYMSPFEIGKQIKRVKPDLIHAHDYTAGVACALFSGKIPVINHLHNNSLWIKNRNIKSQLYRLAAHKFDCILSVSDSIMEEYIFGCEFLKKTKVVGNPFDASKIQALAEMWDVREEYDVLFCGRLSVPKNPLLFIEIILELRKRIPDIRAAMVGDGELKGEVLKRIDEEKLNKTIQLYGFMENPYGMMKKSRLLCMPSLWEGFGLAAVEAMSLGKPVVASPVGGLAHIVDGSCGALCSNLGEFTDRIGQLLQNSEEYEKKSKGAVEQARKMDNVKRYSASIYKIYNKVLMDRKKTGA